ncbi:jg16719 [Pararge aegeria aegeria]|uniref:Jg16719 protein n=1 Tax=Pararge aegeria aegeria TaxID=348720 RepID=A0A8S4S6H6_9NEOP|nr:jg16719 [Pararge aegeria aegeria]
MVRSSGSFRTKVAARDAAKDIGICMYIFLSRFHLPPPGAGERKSVNKVDRLIRAWFSIPLAGEAKKTAPAGSLADYAARAARITTLFNFITFLHVFRFAYTFGRRFNFAPCAPNCDFGP